MLLMAILACHRADDEATWVDPSTLDWTRCDGAFECSTLDRDGASISVVRHLSSPPGGRVAILAGGGPGQSSIGLLEGWLPGLLDADPELWSGETWVAMDDRGVGRSDGIDCVGSDWFDDVRVREPLPADDAAADELRASADAFQQGCLADRSADDLAQLGSTTYADDLDAFREALGVDEIDFLGFSAGTGVGALLAAQHPDHVGRFVLDGVVSPVSGRDHFLDGQAKGFELALQRFFDRCAADETCALHDDPAGFFDDLLAESAAAPLFDSADPDRPLTHEELRFGAAGLLYSPDDEEIGSLLSDALGGDGAGMMQAADDGWGRATDGSYDPLLQAYWAIGCLDQPWPEGWTDEDVWSFAAGLDQDEPRLGSSLVTGELNCLGWPAPSKPVSFAAPDAPPLLLVAGRYDPATPYAFALEMQDALGNGSPILSFEGDGHVAFNRDPSGCAYRAEREFLLTGVTGTTTCP